LGSFGEVMQAKSVKQTQDQAAKEQAERDARNKHEQDQAQKAVAQRRQKEHDQDRANDAMKKANEQYSFDNTIDELYAKQHPDFIPVAKLDANSEASKVLMKWDEHQKTVKQRLPEAFQKLMKHTTNLNQGSQSLHAIVEHAIPVPALVQDAEVLTLTMVPRHTEPVFSAALMQESKPVPAMTLTMVPTEMKPFQPMRFQEEKEQAQHGLWERFTHWFWSEPWDDEVVAKDVPEPVQPALVQVSKQITSKQDVEATADAARLDTIQDVSIGDPWAAMEQEDEQVVEHVKREQRALHVSALTQAKPIMPSAGEDKTGSTHISGFFKNLATEDEAMMKSLDRSGQDITEYATMLQVQNAQVESADHATSRAKNKHLRN